MGENDHNLWTEINEINKCVQTLTTTFATIQANINGLTERIRKIENAIDEKDRRLDDLNLKVESFRVEWKAHTNYATRTEEKKKWGMEQIIAVVAILVALGTAILVPIITTVNNKEDDWVQPSRYQPHYPPPQHQPPQKSE